MQFGQDKTCHSLLLEEGLGIVARPRQGLAERAGRGALTGGHDAYDKAGGNGRHTHPLEATIIIHPPRLLARVPG